MTHQDSSESDELRPDLFAPGAAPTLSFLGSQEFAYVTPAPPRKPQPAPAGS